LKRTARGIQLGSRRISQPRERRYQRFGSFALTICTTNVALRSIGAILFSPQLNRIAPSSDDST
jgi:hypothetical protein